MKKKKIKKENMGKVDIAICLRRKTKTKRLSKELLQDKKVSKLFSIVIIIVFLIDT